VLPDHYAALGVEPGADQPTLRAAYLRIMRAHHPDLRPEDPDAAERARRANAAYAVLRNQRSREAYDRRRRRGHGPPARPHGPPPRTRGDDGDCSPAGLSRSALRVQAPAYSPQRAETQRSMTLASIRLALALFAAGLVLLVAFSPQ
jgi:curved DNA-binding protein CbpA